MVHIIGVNPCLTGVVQCTANGAAIPSTPTATVTATTTASVTVIMGAVPLLMVGCVVWGVIRAPSLAAHAHLPFNSHTCCAEHAMVMIPMRSH
jgi:hypothetical protein